VDEAIRRRLQLLPFTVKIPDAKRDKRLADRLLQDEGDAILGWMIEGWQDYRREGLNPPEVVRAATDAYILDQDAIGRWLVDRCDHDRRAETWFKHLWSDWKDWCASTGEDEGSQKAFGTGLETRGFDKQHRKLGRRYRGLKLKASDAYASDSGGTSDEGVR
jgi:phage/plasmid-associated DNA primase